MKTARLVYQVGIANVFVSTNQPGIEQRVMQHAYGPCEDFCRGFIAAGGKVTVWHCDQAGDVSLWAEQWMPGKGELWEDQKYPPIAA